jgi:hypothetical protein
MTDPKQENGGRADHDVAKVNPREILDSLDAQVPGAQKAAGEPLSQLQSVGVWLAGGVFLYILLASAAIFCVSFRFINLPSAPVPPANVADPERYKQLVDAYKIATDSYAQMAKLQLERATQLFQLVVGSTILPAFTAILGYIFGSKKP